MAEETLIRTDKLGRAPCEHCGEVLDISTYQVFEEITCGHCDKTTTVPGKLGDYFLLRELGRGGMGAVFLGRDAKLKRQVAVKVLNARFGSKPEFVNALLAEAKAAAALNHKNIVHIFSYGQVYTQPYFVMEYVEGIRLDECITAGVETDEEGWLGIMAQVTDGLILSEKVGLIHGDIKPANILLNQQGVAKLSDFGIARFGGDSVERILGTPLYIAPEKARGLAFDTRADQFSLGATFWHLMTREAPFKGKTPKEVVLHRFEIDPPDPRDHVPHLSKAAARLLMRMMAIEPEERFTDFIAVRERIGKILDRFERRRDEAAAAQAAKEEAERLEAEKRRRQKRVIRTVVAIVLVALAAAGAFIAAPHFL